MGISKESDHLILSTCPPDMVTSLGGYLFQFFVIFLN
jgi:hypothetical protein